jgi:hypothetical protein
MMEDYSWIDTWGMDPGMYEGGYSTGTLWQGNSWDWDGSDPYGNLYSQWDGTDPYGNLYSQKPEYGSEWYAGAFDPSQLSSMSLSSLAKLASNVAGTAGKAMGGVSTGNPLIDSIVGLAGGAAGLYGNLQNLDWMDMLSDTRGVYSDLLKDVKNYSPYTGQEVAGLTEAQKQGMGYAPDMLSQGKQWFTGAGTYDPNQVQQYLNPYVEGGLQAANRLTSQNLTENILPGINSTFTGQGQFGSTRNAEFQNRAIRDTQQSIADANAKAMTGAYGQASQDYMTMLGRQGELGQQALQSGMALGGLGQQQNQAELNAQMEAWKRNQQMPLEQFKALTSGVGSFNPAGSGGSPLSGLSSLLGK